MSLPPVILWYRRDLRVADHAALTAAVATGHPIIPVYVFDDKASGSWTPGRASLWWLHHSLKSLSKSLKKLGADLILRRGSPDAEILRLVRESGATTVYCTRGYEPRDRDLETRLQEELVKKGGALKRFGGRLLVEPEKVRTQAGEPFKVYTPFWRNLSAIFEPGTPYRAPKAMSPANLKLASDDLASWNLLPHRPDWAGGLRETWEPGEPAAHSRLEAFLDGALSSYKEQRDRPDVPGTSRLSPHLHFGEISPRMCWYRAAAASGGEGFGFETFYKELVWREFSYNLLYHWPDLPDEPFRPEFRAFPFREDHEGLDAWQRGETGYPIVDAGMRQLWHTGWMHNRIRMVVASFLVKDLMIPWQAGEAWFWDTLVDADLANNAASWQWVAGSGADAAPYYRIFNPVKQGETFDPAGNYVRRWVPELARLPDVVIHAPWRATQAELDDAEVVLDRTYPMPIVDHGEARDRAMAAYKKIKQYKGDLVGERDFHLAERTRD